MTFKVFAAAVEANHKFNSKGELFAVDVEDLFASYLAAFPEGTNPIYRVRTVHDDNADKNFIRRLGHLVALNDDGTRRTVWSGLHHLPHPYDVVAQRLDEIVRQAPIVSVFRTKERAFGSKPNWDNHDTTIMWDHFFGEVAAKHHSTQPDKARGDRNTIAHVLRRGLDEIADCDTETVLDLIRSNAIYRGAEHESSVVGFRDLQRRYREATDRDAFIWSNLDNRNARFRNTVIGTLLTDLGNGIDLEKAVRMFEAKVAPENYKRPTALITPKMIEQAVGELIKLGLDGAVERRYAKIEDVNINDVLFVDNEVRGKMKGGLADLLMGSAKVKTTMPDLDKATPISIADFMALGSKKIELVLGNDQLSNFVSLTAPQHDDTGRLFKWDNDFAWMYDGEVADSLKQRVKAAGGKTGANVKLRVSLGWSNSDDLDIHCSGPDGHVYFGDRKGILDVDMNAGGRMNAVDPVENLSWTNPKDGVYRIRVDMFSKRSKDNTGFVLEIDSLGQTANFAHTADLTRGSADHLILTVKGGKVVKIETGPGITGQTSIGEKWGVKTMTPVRVDTIMLSPNYWDGAGDVGNKHWFFMLDGAKNPEATRGFVNEFLRGSLDPHRKVFEVLSSKTKCPPSDSQLSGVGFSSTRGDAVIAIADGRPFKVQF